MVWNIFYFPIYWEQSSHLTNSYFSEGWPWPTNQRLFASLRWLSQVSAFHGGRIQRVHRALRAQGPRQGSEGGCVFFSERVGGWGMGYLMYHLFWGCLKDMNIWYKTIRWYKPEYLFFLIYCTHIWSYMQILYIRLYVYIYIYKITNPLRLPIKGTLPKCQIHLLRSTNSM